MWAAWLRLDARWKRRSLEAAVVALALVLTGLAYLANRQQSARTIVEGVVVIVLIEIIASMPAPSGDDAVSTFRRESGWVVAGFFWLIGALLVIVGSVELISGS